MLNEPLEMLDPSWRSATPLSLEEASPAYCWRSIYSAMHSKVRWWNLMAPHWYRQSMSWHCLRSVLQRLFVVESARNHRHM